MTAINPQSDFLYQPIYLRAEAFCSDYNRFADWFRYLPKKVLRKLPAVPAVGYSSEGFVVFDMVRLRKYYHALHDEFSLRPKYRDFLRFLRPMSQDFQNLELNCLITSKV